MKKQPREKITLMSDQLFKATFDGNNKNAQEVLRILLEKPDLEVLSCNVTEEFGDFPSSILHVEAKDSNNHPYKIELHIPYNC